ncbi:MAG: HAD family hydrolase, partial [Oscillospiraceae bacterium]|nr:HAD family hydrolase [Oscillospiraceae bacterium]
MAKYSSILFDLDGNLLPMDMDNFIKLYFGALAQYMVPYGFEPKEFIDGIWAGTKAMIKNDGTMANEERFWNTFAEKLGKRVFDYVFTIDSFYTKDFNKAKAATW